MRLRHVVIPMVAAALVACGGRQQAPDFSGGKAGYHAPSPVSWSDGGRTAGAYVTAYADLLQSEFVDYLAGAGHLPPHYPAASSEKPAQWLSIEALPERGVEGHLGFVVPPTATRYRLALDSFVLQVDALVDGEAADYDVALLKFYRQDGAAKSYSVVVRLDEAMAGRVIRPRDEAQHAHGMFAALQQGLGDAERVGFTGTWKVVIVPRASAQPSQATQQSQPSQGTPRNVAVLGTDAVEVGAVWLLAAPSSEPSFIDAYNGVVAAIATGDVSAIDRWTHPDCGIYQRSNPGAHVAIAHADRFAELGGEPQHGQLHASCNDAIELGELPVYRCDDSSLEEGWSKSGCFAGAVSGYAGLAAVQRLSNADAMGNETTNDPAYMAQMERCEASVSRAVTSTDGPYTLYFSEIGGAWYLTVVDLVEPCGA